MQLDDKTANAASVRPTAQAAGAQRWFRARDLGGGITGTTMEADYLNDHLGSVIAILAAVGISRTKGTGGDSDMLNAIKAIVAQGAGRNALVGQLKRTSASVIQLQPIVGTKVSVGIDDVILNETGPISFDMATDLEQSEAASKRLYLYLRNNAGALDAQISETVPDLPGGTKPGYKNGDATWRCIGSTWNNLAQDLIECTWLPGGEVLFHSHDADHEHVLALTQAGWSAAQAVNVPLCAAAFQLLWKCKGNDSAVALAASDATTDPTVIRKIVGTDASEILFEASENNTTQQNEMQLKGKMPIADMASPAFKFTTYGGTLGGTPAARNEIAVTGYTDIFAPR